MTMDTVNSECASNLTMLRSVLLRDEVVTCPLQEVLLPIDTPSGEKTDLDLVQFKLKMRVKTFRFKNKNAVFKMNTKYILFSHTINQQNWFEIKLFINLRPVCFVFEGQRHQGVFSL